MLHRFLFIIIIVVCFCACNESAGTGGDAKDSLAIREEFANSPVLSPEESLQHLKAEQGFTVELVAAEPMVIAPVAMTFDENSRIWVAEMQGYMPDTAGTGEDLATGKIVILEDTNHDGRADLRKLFLDSLVLPRAICLVENGILVAEPPNLWFVERNGDKAGKKMLVDDKYAEGGNVEHQPNGLLRNIDNWIYNAKSSWRYKRKDGRWLKEKTHFRGQWGLSNDDYGRLYYNHNSANVLGDYFFPSLGATNTNLKRVAGFNEKIVADNRVYPARANTGVNRAYMKGILDSNLRLVNFTAACGPLIYRGHLFDTSFYGNAFVPEPSANLVKRNVLQQNGLVIGGRQAYQGREFLASTDERFRPVNCYNAPDGALYLVDMYRGIIQHKTFLTDYLKKEIKDRALTKPLSCGRIYRIVPNGKKVAPYTFPSQPAELVKLYAHPNGWVRDKAQQLVIDKKDRSVLPALHQYLTHLNNPLPIVHAMWTLAEFDDLQNGELLNLVRQTEPHIRQAALSALPAILSGNNVKSFLPALQQLLQQDSVSAPLIVFLAKDISRFDKLAAASLLETAVKNYPGNKYVTDAVLSNLQGRESAFVKTVNAIHSDTSLLIHRQLKKLLAAIEQSKNDAGLKALATKYPEGLTIYKSICQTCHGADGNGIASLAPPLNRSEWVTGDKEKLAAIVLYGMTGPVQVNERTYKSPEVLDEMPGIANNKELSDEDIAQLLSFIRNAWSNKAGAISPNDVERMRRKFAGRQKTFTIDELQKILK